MPLLKLSVLEETEADHISFDDWLCYKWFLLIKCENKVTVEVNINGVYVYTYASGVQNLAMASKLRYYAVNNYCYF